MIAVGMSKEFVAELMCLSTSNKNMFKYLYGKLDEGQRSTFGKIVDEILTERSVNRKYHLLSAR